MLTTATTAVMTQVVISLAETLAAVQTLVAVQALAAEIPKAVIPKAVIPKVAEPLRAAAQVLMADMLTYSR